jgi:hypothetical protein
LPLASDQLVLDALGLVVERLQGFAGATNEGASQQRCTEHSRGRQPDRQRARRRRAL